MNDFEKLKSTLDTLAEEHDLTKITLHWSGQVGTPLYYTERSLDVSVYIESDTEVDWRHVERDLKMSADLEAIAHKAVAKFIAQRSDLKAEAIAKAKAILAAAGE